MKTKLTKLENAWILYDVANSSFVLLLATLIPIYFNTIATNDNITSVDYLAYWGYATSIVTITVAVLGPILGTLSDTKNYKKPIFTLVVIIGVIGCIILGFIENWVIFLIIYIIAKIGYATSLVLYDSMIHDITTVEKMDLVSSRGYAWGYIGSCIPFIIGLLLFLFNDYLGISKMIALSLSFTIIALWWFFNTIPLLKNYKQINYIEKQKDVIKQSFQRLWITIKELKYNKQVLYFLLAFFCYIDGVYTIIDMATVYGTALGLDTTGLLLALLLTQFVAFPCALLFGKLSKKYNSSFLISKCIIAYTFITVFAYFLDSQFKFWILAILVGMFQGGIQALSRSHFAKIIPSNKSGEYFGIFDICGKGASFFGTMLISIASQITGSVNAGIFSLIILFILGYVFFKKSIMEV